MYNSSSASASPSGRTGRSGRHGFETNDLVESHIGLARALARRFAGRGEDLDDLEQVALLALVAAARRFDPEREVKFATFATVSIIGELKRHFRDKTWGMRVPRSLQETYLAVKDARDALTQRLQCSPSLAQIAEWVGVTEEQVIEAMEAAINYYPESLDRSLTDERDGEGIEVPTEEYGFERRLEWRELMESMPMLTAREQVVLQGIYLDDRSQRELAGDLGVSQMQVSRIRATSIEKLRKRLAVR